MRFKISKGLDIPVAGEPSQIIENGPPVHQVALLGTDYLELKPSILVNEGERVKLGQALFADRQRPEILFTSPASGIVKSIERGPRRVLQAVIVAVEGKDEVEFDAYSANEISTLDREDVVRNLTRSGLWTALRTRPYSKIPAPDAIPHSLFVTAIDTNPLAADPSVVIHQYSDEFLSGLDALAHLGDGKIFVCHAPDANLPQSNHPRVRYAEFAGPHPAGLVGTHIHFLDPVGGEKTVWHIGYQDVIAIGKLFTTGRLWTERTISLAGPMVLRPRLIRTRQGASTENLVRDELVDAPCRVISGSVLNGHRAASWAAFLGRYHTQISAVAEGGERELMGWIRPRGEKFSQLRVLWEGLSRKRKLNLSTLQNGSRRAIVPIGNFEDVMPLELLATPLLKALVVGDSDMAQKLGCLELDEEDLALCSFVCSGKTEYGRALRHNLHDIERHG